MVSSRVVAKGREGKGEGVKWVENEWVEPTCRGRSACEGVIEGHPEPRGSFYMSGMYLSQSGGSLHRGDPDLFLPTSHPTADAGEPEGLHATATTSGCGLQDTLWHVSQGVCRPDLPDIGSSAERAQESTYK